MYINSNVLTFTYSLWLIQLFITWKTLNINNKLLSLMIPADYEGSNHCRRNLHNPLSRLRIFSAMLVYLTSYPAWITKDSMLLFKQFWNYYSFQRRTFEHAHKRLLLRNTTNWIKIDRIFLTISLSPESVQSHGMTLSTHN